MVLKPEPLRTATVASTDVVVHDIASPLQPNVSVILTLLMEAHSNLVLFFPSVLITCNSDLLHLQIRKT
jgi:hypothetical protein